MKKMKKIILVVSATAMFVVMLVLSISTSNNGTNFNITGAQVLASGTSNPNNDCDGQIQCPGGYLKWDTGSGAEPRDIVDCCDCAMVYAVPDPFSSPCQ
jgi:hypothetical protein